MSKYKLLGYKLLSGEFNGTKWEKYNLCLQCIEQQDLNNVTGVWTENYGFSTKDLDKVTNNQAIDNFRNHEIEIYWSKFQTSSHKPIIEKIEIIK